MLNNLFKKTFSIAIFSLLSISLLAQEEEEIEVSEKSDTIQGIYFGLNLGTYFANNILLMNTMAWDTIILLESKILILTKVTLPLL
jgi:hypothetical protein